MPYGETKVYFDGSHYIAIPHTTRPSKRRPKPPEEMIVVEDSTEDEIAVKDKIEAINDDLETKEPDEQNEEKQTEKIVREISCRDYFEELYDKTKDMRKRERRTYILSAMKPYFADEQRATEYVDKNLERKTRNLVCRKVRLWRKINLQEFNYFCTFTYDDKLHTEESFQKGLKTTFRNLVYRKGWKYVGVWERSPEKKRLHFHGLFYIPEGTIPGGMTECDSYSFSAHKRQLTLQSDYFNSRFGRNDFAEIYTQDEKYKMVAYIVKYLEKSGEKIVYSKGLPQFFISDIMDEDIAGPIGVEDKKLLLFDDFTCWDEGCYMGKVSPEVISQMRKVN